MKTLALSIGFALLLASSVFALQPSQINKNISAEGSCAVVEMTAEQCQLLALQRARAAAIEQVAHIEVSSSTLVTNMALAVDFIKTYSKGFIVSEKAEWLPLGQYQKDKFTAPIPEYRVKIFADVYASEKKIKPLGLNAKLNGVHYKSGEKAVIEIRTVRKANIAVFNLTADDNITMLFPNEYEKTITTSEGSSIRIPADNSKLELEMQTLPGHKKDTEAFFIAAMDADSAKDFKGLFASNNPMDFSLFFRKYSEIADYCEDAILTYEVVSQKEN